MYYFGSTSHSGACVSSWGRGHATITAMDAGEVCTKYAIAHGYVRLGVLLRAVGSRIGIITLTLPAMVHTCMAGNTGAPTHSGNNHTHLGLRCLRAPPPPPRQQRMCWSFYMWVGPRTRNRHLLCLSAVCLPSFTHKCTFDMCPQPTTHTCIGV